MSHPIRYLRLGYTALQVTDLPASIRFYVDLVGLTLARSDGKSAWLRCSDKPFDLLLTQGSAAGLSRIGFEIDGAGELDTAFAHIARHGLGPRWSTSDEMSDVAAARAFRFRNPDTGLELEFFSGQARADSTYEPVVARIVRLGHVVLNVKNFADAHRFWVEQLGFAVSDHVPGRLAFLRCHPNPLHHSLALLGAAQDGINHFNFMVSDIDDIGRAMNRMKKSGVPIVFGPGRHLPSGSIFLYFLDPDGLTAEYSFGMEEIVEHDARPARELEPAPEVLDMWGGVPDPRFGKTGVIVIHRA